MTAHTSTQRPGRPLMRRRLRCGPRAEMPDAPTAVAVAEADLKRLMAAHLRRLACTPWAIHPQACLACHTQRLADALVLAHARGAGGGAAGWHAPEAVVAGMPRLFTAELRELWLVQLWHAFGDARFPPAQRAGFWTWAEALTLQLMVVATTQPTPLRPPNRYPFALVQGWFAADETAA